MTTVFQQTLTDIIEPWKYAPHNPAQKWDLKFVLAAPSMWGGGNGTVSRANPELAALQVYTDNFQMSFLSQALEGKVNFTF